MTYKFIFNYLGTNYNEEMVPQHVREITINDEVLMNEFFPNIIETKTFFTVTQTVFGKGRKDIYLSQKVWN